MAETLSDQINDELIRLDYSAYTADQGKRRAGQYLLASPDADGVVVFSGGPHKALVCRMGETYHSLTSLQDGSAWDEVLGAIRQHLIDEL